MEAINITNKKFDIKDSLKEHYLFEYPINQLIETFILVFEKEKKSYGELSFSPTIYNISEMIVFKYFNDDLSFAEKAFVRSNKFKCYPFSDKIKEIELSAAI